MAPRRSDGSVSDLHGHRVRRRRRVPTKKARMKSALSLLIWIVVALAISVVAAWTLSGLEEASTITVKRW
jgi:hypothetical protein